MHRAIELIVRDAPPDAYNHNSKWEYYDQAKRDVEEGLGDFAEEYQSANVALTRIAMLAPDTDVGKRGVQIFSGAARRDLGYAAFQLGRHAEAEEIFREWVDRFPDVLFYHTMLALTLCRQGRAAEARDFEQAFTRLAHKPEALANNIWPRRNLV